VANYSVSHQAPCLEPPLGLLLALCLLAFLGESIAGDSLLIYSTPSKDG